MIFHGLKFMLTEKNYKSSFRVEQTGTPAFSFTLFTLRLDD